MILLSTLFFHLAGIANWRYLACIWAVVPAVNAVAVFPAVLVISVILLLRAEKRKA